MGQPKKQTFRNKSFLNSLYQTVKQHHSFSLHVVVVVAAAAAAAAAAVVVVVSPGHSYQ